MLLNLRTTAVLACFALVGASPASAGSYFEDAARQIEQMSRDPNFVPRSAPPQDLAAIERAVAEAEAINRESDAAKREADGVRRKTRDALNRLLEMQMQRCQFNSTLC